MEKIKLCVIGLGTRGRIVYGTEINKFNDIEIVAAVDFDKNKLDAFSKEHNINKEMLFTNADDFFELGKVCDAVLVCTYDHEHFEMTKSAMKLNYDILLEKPISNIEEESLELLKESMDYSGKIIVAHVLRYTPFFKKMKSLVEENVIGDLVSIDHTENIGNYHMAHSYVRGNWRNSEESAPIILTKSSHDLDILNWIVNSTWESVYSEGDLYLFNDKNAPIGATKKCIDCPLNKTCIYSAQLVYEEESLGKWPSNAISADQTKEAISNVLASTTYGNCVYLMGDNDVVDHQVATIKYQNGVLATFTLTALSQDQSRVTRIFGTKGYIEANTFNNKIEVVMFVPTDNYEVEKVTYHPKILKGGHWGGDAELFKTFISVIRREKSDANTEIVDSLESHLLAFAAEKSRISKKIIFNENK